MVSVCLINWNELEVAKDSVRRLLKEPIEKLIVVDNGSTDGSIEYFREIKDPKFELLLIGENKGPSVARNRAIDKTTSKYIFLLDGDILYVRGTIQEYEKILDKYSDAFCVGQNSLEILNKYGHNGTPKQIDADMSMDLDYTINEWFPMAWTQYGLFRGDLLREVKFIEEGVYGEAGWGGEDDWYFHEMKERGYVSLAVDKPIYYHMAHSGLRELIRSGVESVENNVNERLKLLRKRWGKNANWIEHKFSPEDYENRKVRPNP